MYYSFITHQYFRKASYEEPCGQVACNSSYLGDIARRTKSKVNPGKKRETLSERLLK
jgi:hypothetical protein